MKTTYTVRSTEVSIKGFIVMKLVRGIGCSFICYWCPPTTLRLDKLYSYASRRRFHPM